jgi:hypothetical protein
MLELRSLLPWTPCSGESERCGLLLVRHDDMCSIHVSLSLLTEREKLEDSPMISTELVYVA